MPLDPRLQRVIDELSARAAAEPPPADATVAQRRAWAHAPNAWNTDGFVALPPEPAEVSERKIEVDGGVVAVRIYRPHGDGPFGGYVYLHGGGWWIGTLDQCDAICREACVGGGCVVVSVDYRLAPEHPFPIPLEDCYAALTWTVEHADELAIDPARLAVGGGSAGGNLAAAVALLARDRGGPSLRLQVLEVPALDLSGSVPPVEGLSEGYFLTEAAIRECVEFYLGGADPADPLISPIRATDLTGLPAALVLTAEYDPLVAQGEVYAEQLRAAGVPVRYRCWPGMLHGSSTWTGLLPAAREWTDAVSAALRDALARC